MAKKPDITTIASGYYSRQALNSNFQNLKDGFDNTLSLDGSTPNAMQADLDLNGNNIMGAAGLLINGTDYLSDVEAAKAAALVAQAAAETAETNAGVSETNAASSATAASTSATAAATSEDVAEASRVVAEAAAATATTKASEASTSETNAATSASTATTKASEAATSATNAATSATESETAKTAAEAAKDAALAALDSFDDRYLGAKADAPTVDNDGNALIVGALYFNTGTDKLYIWDGAAWQVTTSGAAAGDLISTNNLSDVTSASASRTNLGLVTVASTGSYSDLTGTPTLGTAAATASTDYATAAQGSLADTATQPADLATVATTGAYSDLTGLPTLYSDSSVDTHLNTGTASTGEYLSWNGSDYDWANVPAGYTDGDVDAHLNTGTATTDQVLAWTGSDYDWVDASAGAGAVQAWLNFNGTGTVAIRANGNVSSITDNGSGNYSINFSTSLSSANYATSGYTNGDDSTYSLNSQTAIYNSANGGADPTTSVFRLITGNSGNTVTKQDKSFIHFTAVL